MSEAEQVLESARKHQMPILRRWKTILDGCNLPQLERADVVSKWLVISRSCVLSMTLTSGLIGVLLALELGKVNWLYAVLSVVGLLIAHASNNLINDWTDVRTGVDTEDYPRSQYSTHPILGGLTTPGRLLGAAVFLVFLDLVIMIGLAIARGWPILVFSFSGLALSLLYTITLKRLALGELTSLVVWGPLMTGGTAYAVSGVFSWWTIVASIPYGIVVAAVLIGKHMDKIDADRARRVRTVPAVIGLAPSAIILKASAVLFYALLGFLVAFRVTGPWVLITVFALRRLVTSWRTYGKPRPSEPPENWTVWPLWYVGWAMYFNRQAGMLLVVGLFLNIITSLIVGRIG